MLEVSKKILSTFRKEDLARVFKQLQPERAKRIEDFQKADRITVHHILIKIGINPKCYRRQTIGRIANEIKEAVGLPRHWTIAE